MPAIFAAQGMPRLVDDARMSKALRAWGRALPRPSAGILVVSAHWTESDQVVIGSLADPVPLLYDFDDFPQRFYDLTWPAPPAREVADRVRDLLGTWLPVESVEERGLDHGAFIPLMLMFPDHDVPVVQISQPSLEPSRLFELGKRLTALRHEGVLIFATGVLTHRSNLASGPRQRPIGEIVEFDTWLGDALARRDIQALLDYESRGPHVQVALPTREHFTPLFVALGAAADGLRAVRFPTRGFWYGNSMRSVELH